MRKSLSETWRRVDAETQPEGTDPLLWEIGQLRKVAQDALAHAARTRNLSATASLLRAANGLLDLLARITEVTWALAGARKGRSPAGPGQGGRAHE